MRSGRFPRRTTGSWAGCSARRGLGDYSAGVRFSQEDARAQLDEARQFVGEVTRHLAGGGWIDGAGVEPAGG